MWWNNACNWVETARMARSAWHQLIFLLHVLIFLCRSSTFPVQWDIIRFMDGVHSSRQGNDYHVDESIAWKGLGILRMGGSRGNF